MSGSTLSPIVNPVLPTIIPANPAATTDWTTTVPAGQYWDVLSVEFQITSSAVVGNRGVGVQWGDGVRRIAGVPGAQSTSANSTNIYDFVQGVQPPNAGGGVTPTASGLPRIILPPGYTIGSVSQNPQAGDQYSNIRIVVRDLSQ